MNRDYAKKRRLGLASKRLKAARNGFEYVLMPAWAWMIAGMLLGVALCAIAFMKLNPKPITTAPAMTPEVAVKTEEAATSKKAVKTAQKPSIHFDFYTLLPNSTAEDHVDLALTDKLEPSIHTSITAEESTQDLLPIADINTPAPTNPPTEAAQTKPESPSPTVSAALRDTHIIQAGSYRNLTQAEELKAKLVISGFEASIQTFKKNDQETLYRVYLGPFSSKEQAQQRQTQLEDALKLHSLVLKNRV